MSSHLTADAHGFVPSKCKLDRVVDFYRLCHARRQVLVTAKRRVTDSALDFVRPPGVVAQASDTVRYIGITIFKPISPTADSGIGTGRTERYE